MDTLFDPAVYRSVVARLDALRADAPRQWGKMTPAQALEHTARGLDTATGKKPAKQALLGKAIGWMFRGTFVGPAPFIKNAPTGPDLIVRDAPDFEQARSRLKALLSEFHAGGERSCDGRIHVFFGRLSGAEWGVTQFKHVDHHLRQFGA